MTLLAEAIVHRRAPSQGASPVYKAATRSAIRKALILHDACKDSPYDGPVELEIIFFETLRSQGDMDNKLKVIQDSMNKVVYEDDYQIDIIYARRIFRSETQSFRVDYDLAFEGFISDDPAFYIRVKGI